MEPPPVMVGYRIGLRPGVVANPALNGSYQKGTVLNYSFVAQDGTSNVFVTLDEAPAPASGTVTMDKDHEFKAAIDNQPGSRAPDFLGQKPDGQTVRLSDLRGTIVFVDSTKVNCPGSTNEAVALQAHYGTYHPRGLEIITVLVLGPTDQPSTANDLRTWAQTYGLSFPAVSDPANANVIYNWDVRDRSTDSPAGYLLDGTGVIRYRFKGFNGPVISAALAAMFP